MRKTQKGEEQEAGVVISFGGAALALQPHPHQSPHCQLDHDNGQACALMPCYPLCLASSCPSTLEAGSPPFLLNSRHPF